VAGICVDSAARRRFLRAAVLDGADEARAPVQASFRAASLAPPSGLRAWLAQRRPYLVRCVNAISADGRDLGELLRALYGHDARPIANVLGGAVYLLTPVTVRAEAWLRAWSQRPAWGGRRPGAGRPRQL